MSSGVALRRPFVMGAALTVVFSPAPGAASAQQAVRPTVTVVGTVYDSVAGAPLGGAAVQLAPEDPAADASLYSATSGADGRYRIDSVPAGRYLAGFFHPRLDSLGLQTRPRRLDVADAARRLDLAVPAAATILAALCPSDSGPEPALLVGFVRDAATSAPRPAARARLEWSRVVVDGTRLRAERPGVEVAVRPNGWFAVCGVPVGVALALRALDGADTSAAVSLQVSLRSVAHRDLWLGPRGAVGDVQGAVRDPDGRPVSGARVTAAGARDSALTGPDGAFRLDGVPLGTRVLDVRAVGFAPVRETVDLIAGATSPLRLTLARAAAGTRLDTMRVTSERDPRADRSGFEERRRASSSGYFIDEQTITRRGPVYAADLFRGIPGVQVRGNGAARFLVMSAAGGGECYPQTFVDGVPYLLPAPRTAPVVAGPGNGGASGAAPAAVLRSGPGISAVNAVQPSELAAVEVYPRGAQVPSQFNTTSTGCGVVLFWTRLSRGAEPAVAPRQPDEPSR